MVPFQTYNMTECFVISYQPTSCNAMADYIFDATEAKPKLLFLNF